MLTIVTLMALSIGSLLGGTAIVENIFMWDGVGKMAVDAINMRDYPGDPGICGLDGGDLCDRKSDFRSAVSLSGSQSQTGR